MVEAARGAYGRYVHWYTKWAPAVILFVAGGLLICGIVTAQATIVNGRQERAADLADAQRDRDRDKVFECIDDRDAYAAASSQTLRDVTQVRDDLSQKRGQATIAKERALVEWTDILIAALGAESEATPAQVVAFAKATTKLNQAARALQDTERALRAANRDLTQARADNPVVPPASEVCATGTFIPPKVS